MTNKTYLIGSLVLILIIGYWYFGKSKVTGGVTQPARIVSADTPKNILINSEFLGIKGDSISLVDNQLQTPATDFESNVIKYFNTDINGKKIYFMVVKDENGVYRAAANACEVCFGARKGFTQVGDTIVCNNCKKQYALNTLGVVKGGCNPGPISSNIKIENNNLIISTTELSQVANLF